MLRSCCGTSHGDPVRIHRGQGADRIRTGVFRLTHPPSHGTARYDGAGGDLAERVRLGDPVGEALIPACDDEGSGPGCGGDEGTLVPVFRLSGIDPQVAVGARADGREVYLAAGYFPDLPDHPFHMAIYKSPQRPNERPDGDAGHRFLICLARL